MPTHNQSHPRILTSPCHETIPENRKAHGDCLLNMVKILSWLCLILVIAKAFHFCRKVNNALVSNCFRRISENISKLVQDSPKNSIIWGGECFIVFECRCIYGLPNAYL